ncbi:unnamed protein product, partial [Arabidopsis halleri]
MVVERNGYHYLTQQLEQRIWGHMQYCVDHPEEISKLAKVNAQVTEGKCVMLENNESEKIELLVDKIREPLLTRSGTKMTRKMWFQNMRIKVRVLGKSSS